MRLADRFVLEREVGSGGMARVFLGRDEVLDRPVAVKVLRPTHGDTEIGARFRREGRTAARLSHPNIVQVYDAGEGELEGREVSYIVMEYLSGGDLKEMIDSRGPLPGTQLARFGVEVCSGLAHAHGRGVVHRDIKPHNILLDDNGRAKVSDFGIARALDTTQATQTGAYLGTALYSSPEQLQGHHVTPKSDIYSLGATLYQAAAGEPPFAGTTIEVASQHVSKPPPPLRERGADVGDEMGALILACLAKSADDRPGAEEALSRFEKIAPTAGAVPLATPAAAPREPERRPAPTTVAASGGRVQRPRRGKGVIAALALLALLAVAIGAFALPNLPGSGPEVAGNGGQSERANAGDSGPGDSGQGDRGSDSGRTPQGSQSATATAQDEPQAAGAAGEAAEETVREHYQVAASDDYQDAWNYLSTDYQGQFGSPGEWTSQFRTLESVDFTSGPSAQVNGSTATVSFSTVARHTNKVDRPSLTATLVRENGQWKIDGLA